MKTPFDYLKRDINGYTLADAYRAGRETNARERTGDILKARQQGREDVVEWVGEVMKLTPPEVYEKWQQQLKDWGLVEE